MQNLNSRWWLFTTVLLLTIVPNIENKNMNRPKVLLTSLSIPKVGIDLLAAKCDLITVTKNDNRNEILSKIPGVDAVFWATHIALDKEVLDAAGTQMKTVGTMSAGVNHIDLEELKKRGIKLGNTPKVLDSAVADIAVILGLGAARRLHEGRLKIEQNAWEKDLQWMLGQDIEGSTVGIIGLGGIGQAIVKRLKPFEVTKFLYTGHRQKKEGDDLGALFVSLDTLTKESDFIFVSCPLTDETRGMCNKEFFSKMKKTAVFINISRGQVVVQNDLIDALKTNQIFAAGLDVTDPEPLPTDSELLKLPNCVILPHLGSATNKTRSAMSELTAQNILRGLGGEEMFTPVI